MTPADRLRSLVKEATPGRWYYAESSLFPSWSNPGVVLCDYGYKGRVLPLFEGNARLIALAPQLAELVADMRGYVSHRPTCVLSYTRSVLASADWCTCGLTELLARLDALFEEEQ